MSIGKKQQKWSDELDAKLIELITNGRTCLGISSSINMCRENINKRLREMGYKNYHDAKKQLHHKFVYKPSREKHML